MSKSLAMIHSRALVGVQALPVVVEVHLANGLPAFSTVGLPETAVKESKDRVRGAIINSGFEFPAKRITVNLAPADLPKTGSWFDLPIAIGILLASGQIKAQGINGYEFIGELALDGSLREVSGVLPVALACGKSNRQLIIPEGNNTDAALADDTQSYFAKHLVHIGQHFAEDERFEKLSSCALSTMKPLTQKQQLNYPDISDVKGQYQAKRALEIAACGGHSLMFIGPPGTGKSMLATRLPGLLPTLTKQEAIESSSIYSILPAQSNKLSWQQRPYRAPHHSISPVAMVGGGSNPKPGEVSLAHNGVLFLDELTEFTRSTLEQLREPIESGVINIARAQHNVEYPCQFQMIAACNPCKCGYFGDGTDRCQCSATSIQNYFSKLSGPLMDRIDMHVHLPRITTKELQQVDANAETSDKIKKRVSSSRVTQIERQECLNSQLQGKVLEKHCRIDEKTMSFLELASERLNLSARAYHRILKLARTIADMENSDNIRKGHIAEAIGFRSLDRR